MTGKNRDQNRDVQRDKDRDAGRDAERDQARDAERDLNHDAENSYETSVGRSHGFVHVREDLGAHMARNPHAGPSEHQRVEPQNSPDLKPGVAQAASATAGVDPAVASGMAAMAQQCRALIRACDQPLPEQPASLRLRHLEWMCDQIAEQADSWPTTKLHRWIGFLQAGLIANRLIRLEGAKRMFEEAQRAGPAFDQDLFDHLNPEDNFELDLGGQG